MSKLTIPKNYSSALNLHDTQLAIKTVKDFFQGHARTASFPDTCFSTAFR